MTKPILLVVLASLLSGCVTEGFPYSRTSAQNAAAAHPAQTTALRSTKLQDKPGSPVMLGAAY